MSGEIHFTLDPAEAATVKLALALYAGEQAKLMVEGNKNHTKEFRETEMQIAISLFNYLEAQP